ncbi:hypothetical protein TYRP_011429 [Tyrophagus putrescentiae]|nr:hypothetical protein TYRP_011429 [Tyrophagus putrescentiae]
MNALPTDQRSSPADTAWEASGLGGGYGGYGAGIGAIGGYGVGIAAAPIAATTYRTQSSVLAPVGVVKSVVATPAITTIAAAPAIVSSGYGLGAKGLGLGLGGLGYNGLGGGVIAAGPVLGGYGAGLVASEVTPVSVESVSATPVPVSRENTADFFNVTDCFRFWKLLISNF